MENNNSIDMMKEICEIVEKEFSLHKMAVEADNTRCQIYLENSLEVLTKKLDTLSKQI